MMTTQPYPVQVDCVWVASDRDGHTGAFVTAGVGPIPEVTLNYSQPPLVKDIEEAILKLRKVSGCRLLVSIPTPDSFVELAERGLFVYDWSDVHRPAARSFDAYEPVAVPSNPISFDGLPDALKVYATIVKFDAVAFSDGQLLNVRAHFECDGS